MQPQEVAAEARLLPWVEFFTAETDEQFEAAAQGDQMVEKAMEHLEKLSAKADVRLLAERREMALLMYRMEQEEARLAGEAKGRAEGKIEERRTLLLKLLQSRGIGLTEDQRTQIGTCNDAARLEQWFDQALTATNAEEMSF